MKILLLGELSGLHRELRNGFDQLGGNHEVVTAVKTNKGNDIGEINFYNSARTGRLQMIEDIWEQLKKFGSLKGFDIVQIITPKFFNWRLHDPLMSRLYKSSLATVMVNTGCSNDYNHIAKSLKYAPCTDCKLYDLMNGACIYERPDEKELERSVYQHVDGIVSTTYEYTLATEYAGFGAKNRNITLPITYNPDAARISFDKQRPVEIFYGETRYGYKGGYYILKALERIAAEFTGGEINVTKAKNLPFPEYKRVLDNADIVIDQTNAYGYGMNALYSLAKGKVVLSGKEPESLTDFGIPYDACPVININPDENMIYNELRSLITNRDKIVTRSGQGLELIKNYHDSPVIARQYLAFYEALLAGKK